MGTQTKGSNYAWAVAIACVAFYAVPLGFAANHAGLFITPVMDEFGWSRTDATLFMTIQPWVAAICTPFAGKLISKYNPRWVLGCAVLVFALANLACAWFTEPWQWHLYGVFYGASAAFWMYIATPTMVNRWFAKNNGSVIGVIGVIVALLIQPWTSQWMDIVSIYICPLGAALAAIMFFVVLPRKEAMEEVNHGAKKPVGKWFEYLGYGFIVLCILALILGVKYGGIG